MTDTTPSWLKSSPKSNGNGSNPLLTTALAWQARNTSVVQIDYAEKRPLGLWKNGPVNRQLVPATVAELEQWFPPGCTHGLGAVCGYGGLEMFELESRAISEGYLDLLHESLKLSGLYDLWYRLVKGCCERSPSGGIHVLYQVSDAPVPGNTQLARRPETQVEMDAREPTAHEKKKGVKKARPIVMIETRGTGGFTVVAPSAQGTKAWTTLYGGPSTAEIITKAERDGLVAVARELDSWDITRVRGVKVTREHREVKTSEADLRSWHDILEPHGCTDCGERSDGKMYWYRPGKNSGAPSFTTTDDGLWMFSTSATIDASNELRADGTEIGAYSKAAVSAILNDDMDPREAIVIYGTAAESRNAQLDALQKQFGNPMEKAAAGAVQNVQVPPEKEGTEPADDAVKLLGHSDKLGTSDQFCAGLVLDSMQSALRFGVDDKGSGGWITRDTEVWHYDLGADENLVALTYEKMPHGKPLGKDVKNPTDEDRIENARFERRKRFGSTGGARAVAAKMRNLGALDVSRGVTTKGYGIRLADLDTQKEILWAGGIPWDFRYSAPANIDPGTPHMHSARYTPDSSRPTPLWNAFIAEVWPDPEVRQWCLRVLSVMLTGVADKCLPVLYGDTDHGKTTVINLIADLLGTYALNPADPRLLSAADRAHASIYYALKGARLAFIDEAPRTGNVATERLKNLTGGGAITGNMMGKNPVTFPATHTLVLTANPEHEPLLIDPAIESRTRLMPCDGNAARVVKACAALDADTLGPAWQYEAPGVLAMMMTEAGQFLLNRESASNQAAPLSVKQKTAEIIEAQCPVTAWLEGCDKYEPGMPSSELFRQFNSSRKAAAVPGIPLLPYSETKFGKRLTELGYPWFLKDHGRRFRKLRVSQTYYG